jgi:signal transduction histidine kinase
MVSGDSAQLRAVGTAFLMKRPFIVAPGIVLGMGTLVAAGVPQAQVTTLGPGMASLFGFFCAEAWICRERKVSARWLAWSLHITLLGIGWACALSGGVRSPFLPLTLAPVVIAFAAFGRRPQSASIAIVFSMAVAGLAALPHGWPWPRIPPPYDVAMTGITSIVALVLAYVGVAQLSDTLGRTRDSVIRLREDALLGAMDRLRSQETMREKLAHELKNPLASIKGLAQLSVADASDPSSKRRFDVLLTAVDHMEAVLEEYLSFSRPVGDLEHTSLDLDEVVGEALDLVSTPARAAGVELQRQGSAGTLLADRRRILEALLNVLTNAIEASTPGSSVRVQLDRFDSTVRVRVVDEGEGLPAETRAQVGTPYFTTKPEGTGLGIVVATSALRDHGGTLSLTNNEGRGATATLSIPVEGEPHT